MRNLNQFKAILAAVAAEDSANTLHNMKYHNVNTFDYVGFFSHHAVRNIIIPEFDHVNNLLKCTYSSAAPTMYDRKFLEFTKNDGAPTDTQLDREFWSHYVRNLIHDFCRKTWSQSDCSSGMQITRADADQILRITYRVRQYGPKNIKEWESMIKEDYTRQYEIVYSGMFDVKMGYSGDLGNRTKRPIYLYSYGHKSWANCMAFLLRMHWNNLCANTI